MFPLVLLAGVVVAELPLGRLPILKERPKGIAETSALSAETAQIAEQAI